MAAPTVVGIPPPSLKQPPLHSTTELVNKTSEAKAGLLCDSSNLKMLLHYDYCGRISFFHHPQSGAAVHARSSRAGGTMIDFASGT